MNEKAALRRRMRDIVERLDPRDLAAKSERIRSAILSSELWQTARSICLFASLPAEPDIDPLLDEGARQGKIIFYPRVSARDLELVTVSGHASLEVTRWNLREPKRGMGNAGAPESIDLILVPGLAFSRSGSRLGRGGGFYDRLLSGIPGRGKMGVCFEAQILGELPLEPHDREVRFLVTEAGLSPCPPG